MSLNDELERQGNWLFCRRSLLPIFVLAATFLDFLHGLIAPNDFFAFVRDAFPHYRYFCLAVSLAGLAVRIHTVGHAPAGTSGRNTRGQVADTLNTTGFYSIIRHPLYFGNLLISLGIVLLTAAPASCSSLCSPFRSTTNESCMPKNSFSRASSPNGTAAGVGTFPPFFRSSALGGGRSRSSPSGKFFDRKKKRSGRDFPDLHVLSPRRAFRGGTPRRRLRAPRPHRGERPPLPRVAVSEEKSALRLPLSTEPPLFPPASSAALRTFF